MVLGLIKSALTPKKEKTPIKTPAKSNNTPQETKPKQPDCKKTQVKESKTEEFVKTAESNNKNISSLEKAILVVSEKSNKNEEQTAGTKGKFLQLQQQEENREKAFNSEIITIMDAISISQETIASFLEESMEKVQTDKDDKEDEEPLTKLVNNEGKAAANTKEKGGLLDLILSLGMVAILALVTWWKKASEHEGGVFGWVIATITDFFNAVDWKEVGDKIWDNLVKAGSFLADTAKDVWEYLVNDVDWNKVSDTLIDTILGAGGILLSILDSVYSSLFGDNWRKAKDLFSNWIKEVDEFGFGGWIKNQMIDFLPDSAVSLLGIEKAKKLEDPLLIKAREEEEKFMKVVKSGRRKYMQSDKYKSMSKEEKAEDNVNYGKRVIQNSPLAKYERIQEARKQKEIKENKVSLTKTTNSKNITNTKNSISDSNTIRNIKNGNVTSSISGKVVNIARVHRDGTSIITVRTAEGKEVNIDNVKNIKVKEGSSISKGDSIAKNSTTNIQNSKNIGANKASVVNKKNIIKTSNKSSEKYNQTDYADNSSSLSNDISIQKGDIQSKTINIRKSVTKEEEDIQDNTAQIAINRNFGEQIGKLSARKNDGTIMQTRAQVDVATPVDV